MAAHSGRTHLRERSGERFPGGIEPFRIGPGGQCAPLLPAQEIGDPLGIGTRGVRQSIKDLPRLENAGMPLAVMPPVPGMINRIVALVSATV